MPAKKTNVLKPGDRSPINIDMLNIDPALLSKAAELKARIAEIYKELNRLEKEKNKQVKQSEKTQQEINKASFSNYAKIIQKDCSEYIQAVAAAKKVLFRGIDPGWNRPLAAYVGRSHKKRETKDTGSEIQTGVDKILASKGFTALRHNSIFTSSDLNTASGYGIPFIIFPKNGFSFTWSPKIADFYQEMVQDEEIYDWSEFVNIHGASTLDYTILNMFPRVGYYLGIFEVSLEKHPKLKSLYLSIKNLNENIDEMLGDIDYDYPVINGADINRYISQVMEIIRALETEPKIQDILKSKPELAKDFKKMKSEVGEFTAEWQKNKNLNRSDIIFQKLGYTNQNLVAALKSDHEVMINGEYYALEYSIYKNILKYFK